MTRSRIGVLVALLLALWPASPMRAADGALYSSDDGGRVWTRVETSPAVQTVFDLWADPTRAGRLILATEQSLWTTEDGGAGWAQQVPDGDQPGNVYALAADPDTPGHLWTASERGVWRSQDGGATWQPAGDSTPRAVALAAARAGDRLVLYAGGVEGLSVSEDAGAHWTRDSAGLDGGAMAVGVTLGGELLVGTTSGLYTRADTEREFALVRGLPRGASRAIHVAADGTTYAAVGANLYRHDNGWVKLATLPLAVNGDSPGISAIVGIDDRLLLGTDHGLHASPDWKPVPPWDQLAYLEVAAIVRDPADPGRVYLGVSTVPNALGFANVGVLPSSATTDTPDDRLTFALVVVFLLGGGFVALYARRVMRQQAAAPAVGTIDAEADEDAPA